MAGAGVAESPFAGVEDGDEHRGEGVGLEQAGVIVEAGDHPGRAGLDGGEGPEPAAQGRHHGGRLQAVTGHVAHDDPDLVLSGQGDDVVPVAAHHRLTGGEVAGGERQAGEGGEAAREVGPLEHLRRLVLAGVQRRPGRRLAGQRGDLSQQCLDGGAVLNRCRVRAEAECDCPAHLPHGHERGGDDRTVGRAGRAAAPGPDRPGAASSAAGKATTRPSRTASFQGVPASRARSSSRHDGTPGPPRSETPTRR